MDLNYKYTIYKTTNKVNGKVYIGCHKTIIPTDDYIGSGTILKRAIKKYGRENFEKVILFVFNTPEEMFSKEAEVVDRLFIESDVAYNIIEGGNGGWKYCNEHGFNIYGKNGENGKRNLLKGKDVERFLREHGMWDEWRKKLSVGHKKYIQLHGNHWTGRKHREESKRKIGMKLSIAQRGKNNSQYGTCWVYSLGTKKSLRIKKEELSAYLKHGWKQGRKMNFNPDMV